MLAFRLGENLSSRKALEECISLARQIGASRNLASALGFGSLVSGFLGDLSTGRDWADESSAISQQHGYAYELALVAGTRLFLTVLEDRTPPPGFEEETLRLARASGNPWAMGIAVANIGRLAVTRGRLEDALAHLEQSASHFQKLRDRVLYYSARSECGHVLRKLGRLQEAAVVYCETIRGFAEMGHRPAVAHELESLAFLSLAQGQPGCSARLLGAAEALRERLESGMLATERAEYDEVVATLRDQLDEQELASAWTEGRVMTMEQAIEIAVQQEAY
jgi:hypothetical protein